MEGSVEITSRDYWFKIIEMLQQNWALIDTYSDQTCKIYFVNDTSGVFDEIDFPSVQIAHSALLKNGFTRFEDDTRVQGFIKPPDPPFCRRAHPNGPIYSSGRFWH